jgi:hypothetical protein
VTACYFRLSTSGLTATTNPEGGRLSPFCREKRLCGTNQASRVGVASYSYVDFAAQTPSSDVYEVIRSSIVEKLDDNTSIAPVMLFRSGMITVTLRRRRFRDAAQCSEWTRRRAAISISECFTAFTDLPCNNLPRLWRVSRRHCLFQDDG